MSGSATPCTAVSFFSAGFDSLTGVDSSLTSPTANTPGRTPKRTPSSGPRRRLAVVAVVLAGFLLTGCTIPDFGEYKGSTTQGRTEFHLWQGFFVASLFVGGFVLCLILWAVFRYRRRTEEIPTQTQYHTLTEIIYTVVPIAIVLVLFVFTVLAENKVDATPSNPGANVRVYAFQWGWEFEYSGGPGSDCPNPAKVKSTQNHCVKIIGETTEAPTMIVPYGTNTQITLSSLDVLHGFYVPQFNFSRYASPGYTTVFDFNVLHKGIYRGQCTQLCGLYHSLMFFNVKAISQTAYAKWLHTEQAEAKAHPSSVPQLPTGVHPSNASGGNLGGDLYGD
jgi:cytochrome c oxidase subunit II